MKNLLVAAVIGVLAVGCSRESPTTSGPLPTPESGSADGIDAATLERQIDQLKASFAEMSAMGVASNLRYATVDEDFNCENVEEVRARFSDPGYIDFLDVGLFVKFVSMPAGSKKLRIWWDYDNAFDEYQDIDVGDGDVNPEDASRFDVEMVIEHGYETSGRKQVRVELIVSGESGNCARNRRIVVVPRPVPGVTADHVVTFGGVPSCTAFFGSRTMGLWADFTPPLPAGTTYTVSFRVTGAGVVPPSLTIAMAGNTAGPDVVTPPTQSTPPPNDFTATLSSTVEHKQLQIATQIFSFLGITPTSMNTELSSIDVPGKTVRVVGKIQGSCP